ncbi:MAG: hypothetical protein KF778_16415 [Rhodocyclaceae bacterium]|nr:hypothetical protein [Rhodocyclaceae bacterium]
MASPELIQLHLVSPAFVEPTPDKTTGRFGAVLRSVGASKSVYVRPRMITAVASTKYKTRSGLPVTLVGLHGKDELLVVGPDWAILKLASGEAPKALPGPDIAGAFDKALQFVLEEMFWLQRLEMLLTIAQSLPTGKSTFSDPIPKDLVFGELNNLHEKAIWKEMSDSVARYVSEPALDKVVAEGMLQGMLARSSEECIDLFRGIDVREYSKKMLSECLSKYTEFVEHEQRIYDVHPVWWGEWRPEDKVEQEAQLPNYLTVTGRNITKYHFSDISQPDEPKPRRYSMHRRWNTLLQKHCAKVVSSECSPSTLGNEVG